MGLDEATHAWVPSPGATWQSVKTPLELAKERLSRSQPWAVQVSALKLLAHRRSPLALGRDEVVSTGDINQLATDVIDCLADDHWRVREAALGTIQVWGIQAMGAAAVAEAEAKAEKKRQEEIKRNTPMRTYAEAHHQRRIRGVEANVNTLALAAKWAERGRMLVRRRPEATPTIDATNWQGDGKRRDAGSGRTQEIFVVCPEGQREGDALTVVTAAGGEVTVTVPYGVMAGMEFVVVVELPSIESVILSQRISRRFRASTTTQLSKLRHLVTQMDNNADGMLSRAELSAHLKMDRELVVMLKRCGHSPAGILNSLGTHGMISTEDFLTMISPQATLQEEADLARAGRMARDRLEEDARDAQAQFELAWSQAARSVKTAIDYEQAHARELKVVARLADIHPAVRTAAAECIASLRLDASDFLPALGGQLMHNDWRVRASAATAVGRSGRRGVGLVGTLLQLLSDADAMTRAAAAEAIGRCHAPDGSSDYAARLLRKLQPLLTDPQWICREKSAAAVGAVIKTHPVLIYNAKCLADLACLLADFDSRVRCAAVTGLQSAGAIPPGNSLRTAAARPLGGTRGGIPEGSASWRKFGWRAAEYVQRAMPDELPELSVEEQDAMKRPDSEDQVTILNEQHLTIYLTVRRQVTDVLEKLGIAAAAAAAAAARPVYAARLATLLEKPASEHPVDDEEEEEPTGLSRVRSAARSAALSRARQSLFLSLDDNGDGVVTAAEIRLKLSEDKELQKLLIDVLNEGAEQAKQQASSDHDEQRREAWAMRTSLTWLAKGLTPQFPPPLYPTASVADKMADLALAMGRGQWYQCYNNHPYYVDSCGLPVEEGKCMECGLPIGGERYALIESNRPSPAGAVESIATEIVVTEQDSKRIADGWSGHHDGKVQNDEEEDEGKKKKKYVFDKDAGKYVLHIDEVTDGYAGDSDTNASSQWSEESLRSIKSEDESYSEYYSRLGVFLGVGVYCWHRAVGEGANLRYRLKVIEGGAPTGGVTPEPSAETLAALELVKASPSGGLTPAGRKAELAVLGDALGSGRWYECHKGHPYYVGGCGLPLGVVSCPDCALPIGGNRHRHDNTNRPMSLHNIQGIAHEIVTDSTAVRLHNPYVEPPASQVPPEDIVLRRILAQLDADGNRRVDLNEFLELLVPAGDQDDDEPLVAAGLPTGLRIGVSKALGRFGAPRHAAILAVMCKDIGVEVKQAASQALRELGAAGIPRATVARLAEMLSDSRWRASASTDWQIAGALIDTLGLLGSQAMEHNNALTKVLASATPGSSRGWETRALAAAALGKRGHALASDTDAVAALVKAVQTDHSWHVRRAAVVAMGHVGPDLAQHAWVVQRLGDRDETVRSVCTEVLRDMNVTDPWLESKIIMADLVAEVVEEELGKVSNEVLDVTRAAAMRLGVVDVLARRLKSGTVEDKWQAVQAVQRMGARAAEHAPLVAQLLTNDDESLVRNAIVALAAIGPKSCDAMDVGGLDRVIVSAKQWETRAEAVQCVRVVAAARALQMRFDSAGRKSKAADRFASRWASAVAPALADRHKDVRSLADRAMGSLRVKVESHVEEISAVLSGSGDWHCRREACRVLESIGKACSLEVDDEGIRNRLLELFRSMDTDGDMELDKAEITQKLKQDFELQRLLAAIERTPDYVMEHLDDQSGTIKLTDFLDIFKPATEAQRLSIAMQAAAAVATFGLVDSHYEVRESAKTALRGMGDETAIKALTDRIAAASEDESKIAAAEAMVSVLSSGTGGGRKSQSSVAGDALLAAERTLQREARALLDSPNWQVRAAGAASLGAAGALAKSFLAELEALCDTAGTLSVTGTPAFRGEGILDGEYYPADSKAAGRVMMWKRGGQEGKRDGGMLVYDGGLQPCPRWVFVRGFEALTETALNEAIYGNTVHVGNLRGRFEEKESEVQAALLEFGQVLGITIRNRRHMQKPSWALATFASRSSADRSVPLDGTMNADGPARSFWIAKVDARQVSGSTGGMGKTMRTHMAKLADQQSVVDEVGWSAQWSTRRNVRSADFRNWRGEAHTWSLRQQRGSLLGVKANGELAADAPPCGGMGTKAKRSDDIPVGVTGWRWAGAGREEVAVRIDRNLPAETSAAVVNAAKRAVVAIKQAISEAEASSKATAVADGAPPEEQQAQEQKQEEPSSSSSSSSSGVKAELSKDALAELEAALTRDEVAEFLIPFSDDMDPLVQKASSEALKAWQEAARKKVITGRGTRQAQASSAKEALQKAVRRVAVKGSVVRGFQADRDAAAVSSESVAADDVAAEVS
jgi:hypothetical protein